MSCLIHHFSHNVRSTYLTYSHFYYLHLSIPYILYHLYFIFHFSFKSFISNLSSVYFFNISIPYIYIHMRCWTKLFCQGKNNIYDFSKPLLLFMLTINCAREIFWWSAFKIFSALQDMTFCSNKVYADLCSQKVDFFSSVIFVSCSKPEFPE